MSLSEQQARNHQREGESMAGQGQSGERKHLPLPARAGLALLGLAFVAAAILVPASLVSEAVWALLFLGCVGWEAVGVFKEKRWSQEPLTRLYRDRLMRLPRWGKLFRIGFLFLFVWWLAHWLLPGF